jgi:hypothetical protein
MVVPTWAWVAIVLAAVGVVAAAAWQWTARRKTQHLRGQFGPEYDRTLESAESRREAEAELAAREQRHEGFELRPLTAAARSRYVESWRGVQEQFVDDPRAAVASADSVIQSVMHDCGYPFEDFDQRAADLSVDHPDVIEHYREGHRLAEQSARGEDSTEDLRLAMKHYRALFDQLVNSNGDRSGSTNDLRRAGAGKEK